VRRVEKGLALLFQLLEIIENRTWNEATKVKLFTNALAKYQTVIERNRKIDNFIDQILKSPAFLSHLLLD